MEAEARIDKNDVKNFIFWRGFRAIQGKVLTKIHFMSELLEVLLISWLSVVDYFCLEFSNNVFGLDIKPF